MFTLPPRPPKDYILKDVANTQVSAPEHTPSALPRATQTTLRKFCFPVPASDDEPADKSSIEELNDRVLNLLAKASKAWWVDKPGTNAYFLDDIFKTYSVVVDPDYDPRYKHLPRVFQRSYKYELDCLEEARLKRLWEKIKREQEEESRKEEKITTKANAKEKSPTEVASCKLKPPFWWKTTINDAPKPTKRELSVESSKNTYQTSYLRWQNKPNIFEASQTDPCKRRDALAKVGQPFKHEACTWYFKNYPPPNIKFIPEKFAK